MSTLFGDFNYNIDTTGFIPMENKYLMKIQGVAGLTPKEVEAFTGLQFLRVDDNTDRLHWPIHYKVVDEKKWAMIRLKYSV